jgi:cell division protein FtsI/penicillin-binding protein 2
MRRRRVRRFVDPWKEPTYADSTIGDHVDGEDLLVRRAAVEALGPLNGTVVAVDASTGRVLTIVNQKTAFENGYTPCSTVKVFVGMAGLNEQVIERETPVAINSRLTHTLTSALAKSDNPYFARLGEKLGFERVVYYAHLFGLGEPALLSDPEERAGTLPRQPPPDGVGMMSSFGHGISLTPLQLAGAFAALASGGTLHHLQYPRSRAELEAFKPRVKRHLDIGGWLEDLKPGLMAAVEEGTARRAGYNNDSAIYGKTGTCTDTSSPTHLGWFGSFNDAGHNRMAIVVLLTGGRPINGPVASGVAGRIYRTLTDQGYFANPEGTVDTPPVALAVPGIRLQ